MQEYKDWSYNDLRAECKLRGIKAKGNTDALIDKLVADDLAAGGSSLKPTDPNPKNPNWDMAGRWIRR